MACADCGERSAESPHNVCFRCRMLSIRWNGMRRLAAAREGNYTQREIRDEIYQGARETGKDIQRYTGRQKDG